MRDHDVEPARTQLCRRGLERREPLERRLEQEPARAARPDRDRLELAVAERGDDSHVELGAREHGQGDSLG